MAIDAQLDPHAQPAHQRLKLEQAAAKIRYWQKRAAEAARFHRARRERELRALGIDLDQVARCPPWPSVSRLDFAEPLNPERWVPL